MKYNVVLPETNIDERTITYLDNLNLNNNNNYQNINLCIPNGPTDKYEVGKNGVYYNNNVTKVQLDKKVTLVPIIVGGIGSAQGQSQGWWQGENYYCQCTRELRTGDLVVLKANRGNFAINVSNINNSTVIRKTVNYTDGNNYLGYVFTISSSISIKALRSALLLYVYDLQTSTPVMRDNVKVVECRCVVIASGRAGEIRST